VVIVENLCSLPLNPPAATLVAEAITGRPAVLHHHDLPWQRPHLAHLGGPPDDDRWLHVTINDLSRHELATRGIGSFRVYNHFDCDPLPGRRQMVRAELDVDLTARIVFQPTRALERKGIPTALALAEELEAVYWILGPAEDGYDLDAALAGASTRTIVGRPEGTVDDWYAAADVVAFPSSWEGFGNPTMEAAVRQRPLAIGHYPVAEELRAFGFEWYEPDDINVIDAPLELLVHNHEVARAHFNVVDLPNQLATVLDHLAW
jgi:glycosyltransferase involved in cell wall biosynthesis